MIFSQKSWGLAKSAEKGLHLRNLTDILLTFPTVSQKKITCFSTSAGNELRLPPPGSSKSMGCLTPSSYSNSGKLKTMEKSKPDLPLLLNIILLWWPVNPEIPKKKTDENQWLEDGNVPFKNGVPFLGRRIRSFSGGGG